MPPSHYVYQQPRDGDRAAIGLATERHRERTRCLSRVCAPAWGSGPGVLLDVLCSSLEASEAADEERTWIVVLAAILCHSHERRIHPARPPLAGEPVFPRGCHLDPQFIHGGRKVD